jgi:hypothetical protein
MRKQTQITLISPHTNNWGYKGTEHRDGQPRHGTQNLETPNRTTS